MRARKLDSGVTSARSGADPFVGRASAREPPRGVLCLAAGLSQLRFPLCKSCEFLVNVSFSPVQPRALLLMLLWQLFCGVDLRESYLKGLFFVMTSFSKYILSATVCPAQSYKALGRKIISQGIARVYQKVFQLNWED